MKIDSFKRLYIHALQDIYSAETQIVEAMPEMIEAATNPKLKESFEEHLEETKQQVERLDKIFEKLEFDAGGYECEVMEALIEEAQDLIEDAEGDSDVLDAGLIAAAQKVEHYEISSYGTAAHYAEMLGEDEAAKLLGETLEEEKKTDAKLNDLAKNMINPQALGKEGGEARPS